MYTAFAEQEKEPEEDDEKTTTEENTEVLETDTSDDSGQPVV